MARVFPRVVRVHNARVSHADLTLAAWLDLSDEAAGRSAATIARQAGARLAGIHSLDSSECLDPSWLIRL